MEDLPADNKENHYQQRLKDAPRKNVVFSPNRLGPTAAAIAPLNPGTKPNFQPKSILKAPSFKSDSSSDPASSYDTIMDNTAEGAENDFIATVVDMLKSDVVNDRVDVYQALHTKFRVYDEAPYLGAVEDHFDTFVEAFKRDIAQTESNSLYVYVSLYLVIFSVPELS